MLTLVSRSAMTLLLLATNYAYCQVDNDVVAMAERLCKTKGNSTDIKLKIDGSAQSGKVVAQIMGIDGKVAGTGEFSKSEWEGIRFVDSPAEYVKCLDLVLSRIKKTHN